jgi:hypothetical protein
MVAQPGLSFDWNMLTSAIQGIEEIRIAFGPRNRNGQPEGLALLIGDPGSPVMKEPGGARVGPNAILIGEPAVVKAARQRLAGPASAVVAPREAHMWIAGYPGAAAALLGAAEKDLEEIRSFALSIFAGKQLGVAGSVEAGSAENAARLLAMVKAWEGAQKGALPLKIEQSGSLISFAATLTEQQMRQAMRERHTIGASIEAKAAPSAAEDKPAVPAPPAKVRIQGLEADTVELPFSGKPNN